MGKILRIITHIKIWKFYLFCNVWKEIKDSGKEKDYKRIIILKNTMCYIRIITIYKISSFTYFAIDEKNLKSGKREKYE